MDSFSVEINQFSGPYDLLLDQVKKNKIDIFAVSISEIVRIYQQAIESDQYTIEDTSLFVYTSSKLLVLKSKQMLLQEIEEDEEVIDFKENLIFLKNIQALVYELQQAFEEGNKRYFKIGTDLDYVIEIDKNDFSADYLLSFYPERTDKNEKRIVPNFTLPSFKIEKKMSQITTFLNKLDQISIYQVIDEETNVERITSLLGSLELSKNQFLKMYQQAHLDDIILQKKESVIHA